MITHIDFDQEIKRIVHNIAEKNHISEELAGMLLIDAFGYEDVRENIEESVDILLGNGVNSFVKSPPDGGRYYVSFDDFYEILKYWEIDISKNDMYKWFYKSGYLEPFKNSATPESIEKGYMFHNSIDISKYGSTFKTEFDALTTEGEAFFINEFLEEFGD